MTVKTDRESCAILARLAQTKGPNVCSIQLFDWPHEDRLCRNDLTIGLKLGEPHLKVKQTAAEERGRIVNL